MPFDPTDPKYASPLAAMAQDRMSGMLNQPQMKVFSDGPQDGGTNPVSPIMPGQIQLNRTMGMAKGGQVNDDLSSIKDTIRAEFAARGLDFDRFVQNPAVMDEVGKSLQSQGQNGDTILAHINPTEAEILKNRGGSGSINPYTGLPEFVNPGDIAGGGFGSGNVGGGSSPSSGSSGGSSANPGDIAGGGFGSGNVGGGSSWSGGGGGGSDNRNYIGGSNLGNYGGSGSGQISTGSNSSGNISAGVSPVLSPMGAGNGAIPMGQGNAPSSQATRPEPSVPSYDLMSGSQIGGASNLSNLGQLAAVPTFTGATIALEPTSVDLGNTAPQLSEIDFSNISPGMYQGATMPGGISNFAAIPQQPGYTDTGITALRMAAGLDGRPGTIDKRTGIGYGAEFYMNQLGELAPVAQTPGATILNRLMDEGYNPAFDIYGVGRTNLEQAMLQAGADGNLTAAPGRSMHNFGLAMDVENLPDQGYRDLARIAKEEGWGWGTMQDPAHVQMAPWGAGAAQTARRLGAEPFTGPATTASMFTPADPEKTALNSALNSVSNIASELFGVTPAQAEEAPAPVAPPVQTVQPPNEMLDKFFQATFTGAEPMSPFIGSSVPGMSFYPRSQQQMLDVLGIEGSPTPTPPDAQVAGSGVFPSYPQTSGTQPVPVAGKIGIDPQSGRDLFVDINSNEFTVNPGTGARQYTKFSTSTPASPVSVSPSTFVTRSVTPPPQPQTVVTGLTPVQKVQDRAPGASSAGLTGFEAALGTTPVAQASSLGPSPQALGTEFTDLIGTTPQGNYLFSNLDLATKTIPNTYTVNPESVVQQVREKYPGLSFVNYGANTPENNAAMAKDIIGGLGEYGLSFSGNRLTGDINQPSVQEMLNTAGIKEGTFVPVTQTTATTDWSQPAAGPYQSVSYGAQPTSFAGLTPLSPLQQVAAATAAPVVSTTGQNISPRQEPADPTQSTSPMTAEQLQDFGVYKTPLKEGQTVRQNFNEAYADATRNKIEVFEWTNPANGRTEVYKSGFEEADLPAKNAKPASGQQAPQTDYERRVAELENADMIANGMSKEEYAEAMGVPVDQVKTRITTQFGPPMAEYYTKTVLESLAGMTGDEGNFAGLMNLTSLFSPIGILGLGAKAGYNAYRKGRENKADGGYVSPLASIGKR